MHYFIVFRASIEFLNFLLGASKGLSNDLVLRAELDQVRMMTSPGTSAGSSRSAHSTRVARARGPSARARRGGRGTPVASPRHWKGSPFRQILDPGTWGFWVIYAGKTIILAFVVTDGYKIKFRRFRTDYKILPFDLYIISWVKVLRI